MASGFGAEDSYGVYDKALFADRTAAGGLYRPKPKGDDEDGGEAGGEGGVRTEKFKADRGFKGAEVRRRRGWVWRGWGDLEAGQTLGGGGGWVAREAQGGRRQRDGRR